jgi:hypothetical protein
VTTGKERNVRVLPALAAVRVRAAAGLVKESGACLVRVSLSGDIERDTDRDKLSAALDSTPVSPLSRRRDLAVDALVGCRSLDFDDSTREEERGNDPPRAR